MTADPILAIDLGKYKCVACAYDRATAAADYRTVTTSRAEVERLIRAARPAVVAIEACALAGWVHDLCAELRIPYRVAVNPRPDDHQTRLDLSRSRAAPGPAGRPPAVRAASGRRPGVAEDSEQRE